MRVWLLNLVFDTNRFNLKLGPKHHFRICFVKMSHIIQFYHSYVCLLAFVGNVDWQNINLAFKQQLFIFCFKISRAIRIYNLAVGFSAHGFVFQKVNKTSKPTQEMFIYFQEGLMLFEFVK